MALPSHYGSGFAYFFSSFKNISSIIKIGHLSRKEVISNPTIDWEDISPRKEHIIVRERIHEYISLYFGTHTATQFRHEQNKTKIAFIRYDADALFQQEFAWFTEIAYQKATEIWRTIENSENLSKLDWDLINSQRGFRSKGRHSKEWPIAQAELLLKNKIEPSQIFDIVFCSEKEKEDYLSKYGLPFDELDQPIDCVVDDSLFIKTKCLKCKSVDNVDILNYNTQRCAKCEHSLDYSGRYGRYRRRN